MGLGAGAAFGQSSPSHPRPAVAPALLPRSLARGGRVLPRERHADVLMENGTQLDPGLESGAVSIGSGEVTNRGISSHDLPEGESVDRHKCDAKFGRSPSPSTRLILAFETVAAKS